MKKLFSALFLCVFMASFVSCDDDDDDPYWYFWDEPAFVKYTADNKPMLKTGYGTFSAPTLSDTLKAGDYLLTQFEIDLGNQPTTTDTTVSKLSYKRLCKDSVKISSGEMKDDYTALISKSELDTRSIIDNVWFFKFLQQGTSGETFEYEIICNKDSVQQIEGKAVQTLYIRAKSSGQSSGTENLKTFYGFDMNKFIKEFGSEGSKSITVNIKYKSGTNSEGKDIYKPFQQNPVTIPIR